MKGFLNAFAHKLSTIDKVVTGKETVCCVMRHAAGNPSPLVHQAADQCYWFDNGDGPSRIHNRLCAVSAQPQYLCLVRRTLVVATERAA